MALHMKVAPISKRWLGIALVITIAATGLWFIGKKSKSDEIDYQELVRNYSPPAQPDKAIANSLPLRQTVVQDATPSKSETEFEASSDENLDVLHTRFGTLRIVHNILDSDNYLPLLYYNDRLLIKGEGGVIGFVKLFRIKDTDVILFEDDITGTMDGSCPVLYYFITISKSGAKVSPQFGTCNEITHVRKIDDSIRVSMYGFKHWLYSSEAEVKKAFNTKYVYIYKNGVVTENDKRVK